ncbi:hypothetical protein ACOJBO_30630 [Rhizobium beringeri]
MKYIDHIADPSRSCAIVAHRGAWHQAPENSLAAIENAIAGGYVHRRGGHPPERRRRAVHPA